MVLGTLVTLLPNRKDRAVTRQKRAIEQLLRETDKATVGR
jgi:hypothetical protein